MPGYETSKDDTWMQWICQEFAHRHPDDRFTGCNATVLNDDGETVVSSEGAPPNYAAATAFADDDGPVVRRFSSTGRSMVLTPRAAYERDAGLLQQT